MEKPTIVFIIPGPTYYASTPLFQNKYKYLSRHFKGHVFTGSDKQEQFKIDEFTYNSQKTGNNFNKIRFFLFCLLGIVKINKRDKIDCVITYDPLKTGFIGLIIKIIFRSKLIVEVNGVYDSPVVWVESKKGFWGRCKGMLAPKMMKFVLSLCDGIKLQTPYQLEGLGKIKKNKIVECFTGWVSTSAFENLGEEKEVLFVGFPFYIKGVDVLIRSFKKIAVQFPDWKLKIMGWYPDLSALEEAMGGHPQIYHHPPVPTYKMPEHVGKCGIFVLPSRSEAMGRVLLESAASGKPRIGSNAEGIPYVINDGVDGFLFESENEEQLADKLAMLMADPELREKIGNNAAKRARADFSEKSCISNYVMLFNKVLSL